MISLGAFTMPQAAKFPILIVEDDAAVAKTICEWVGTVLADASCHIATNLAEALVMMRSHDFMVVVIDLSLPDASADSKQAVYAIYEQEQLLQKNMKKIIFTGGAVTDNDIEEVKKLGVDTYLIKPKGFRALIIALKDACHG